MRFNTRLAILILVAQLTTPGSLATVHLLRSSDCGISFEWLPPVASLSDSTDVTETVLFVVPPRCEVSIDPPVSADEGARAECISEGFFRQHRLIAVRIVASEPVPAGRARHSPCVFTLRFDRPEPAADVPPDPLDPLLRSIVANPSDVSRRGSAPEPSEPPIRVASTETHAAASLKVAISHDGPCRIPFQESFGAIDPRNLRIEMNGVEIPVRVRGEEDGVFDPDDSIELLGVANRLPDGSPDPYSDTSIYWISGGSSAGMRLGTLPAAPGSSVPASHYTETLHSESDQVYFDTGYYWMRVLAGQAREIAFRIDHAVASQPLARLRLCIRGGTDVEADPDHHVRILLNGQIMADRHFDGYDRLDVDTSFPLDRLVDGDNTFGIECPGDTGAGEIDAVYLDWFEIVYPRHYVADQATWTIRSPDPFTPALRAYFVTGFPSQVDRLFRTSDPAIEWVDFVSEADPDGGYRLRFAVDESAPSRYIACAESAMAVPDSIEVDAPSDWRTGVHGADLIIITHHDFLEALDPLVACRRAQGLRVEIVDVGDVYDEFNAGVFDPHAITDFCRHAYAHWQAPAPAYVLLVGDASWDYKQRLPQSMKQNFVPSYTKTWFEPRRSTSAACAMGRADSRDYDFLYGEPMVDDQFVCVSGDDVFPDMMIGRWPVETVADVEVMVRKTIAYEATARDQQWLKQLTMVTGGFDDSEQSLFLQQAEALIGNCVLPSGGYWHFDRIYKTTDNPDFGAYEDAILAAIDSGTSIVTFLGHAGSWSWEAMFDFDDLARMNNQGRLPFIASMTCNTARFANPDMDSFGEQFILTEDPFAGAVAFWGGCNFGGFWADYFLTYFWYEQVFLRRAATAGEAILAAKIRTLASYPDYGVIIEPYTLLGDPALRIQLPSAPIVRLAGWFDTEVSMDQGGRIRILAWVFDPDGASDIDRVELLAGGVPSGIELKDDGMSGDLAAGDSIFGLQVDVGEGLARARYGVGIRAVDGSGYAGSVFPLSAY